ncbi:MAG: LysE family translocator [Pseudomonadota bacterium]
MWIEFLVTSFVVVVAPGTGVIYTVGVGLSRGAMASLAAAFGCTCGILPHMAAAIAGLAALLHTSALAFQTLKLAGIAYLLYLAWAIWREEGPIQFNAEAPPKPLPAIAITGFLINILNPKLSIFFLAFLPQFAPAAAENSLTLMIGMSAIFMAMTFCVFVLYGVFAAKARAHLFERPRVLTWIKHGFAAAFLVLAARLAFARA